MQPRYKFELRCQLDGVKILFRLGVGGWDDYSRNKTNLSQTFSWSWDWAWQLRLYHFQDVETKTITVTDLGYSCVIPFSQTPSSPDCADIKKLHFDYKLHGGGWGETSLYKKGEGQLNGHKIYLYVYLKYIWKQIIQLSCTFLT